MELSIVSGKSYRPSNGTEGELFQEEFCYRCKLDDCDEGCDILLNTMIFGIKNEDYPKEWVFDEDGRPTCTAFDMKD